MVHQLEDGLRVLEYPGEQLLVKVTPVFLELCPRQMAQIVVRLPDELLCIEEGVDEEAATGDLTWHPAAEALIKFALGHRLALQSTKSRPVCNS